MGDNEFLKKKSGTNVPGNRDVRAAFEFYYCKLGFGVAVTSTQLSLTTK